MTSPINTNEDVKFLAENVMGWSHQHIEGEYISCYPNSRSSSYYPAHDQYITQDSEVKENWNPYTNTDDFLEVVRALDNEQRTDIHVFANQDNPDPWGVVEATLWLTDPKNRVAILTALIETLKQDKGWNQ